MYTPLPVHADLASILNHLTNTQGQSPPAVQPSIPSNIDLSALLSQFQPQPPQPQLLPQQGSPPPRWSREERSRKPERCEHERSAPTRKRSARIKASRLDDVRDAVRNSNSDQNMYRALCQFYVPSFTSVLM
jgi:hypothetical protein